MRFRHLACAFILCAVFTLPVDVTLACSCGPAWPVLDAYERADAVVIARVLSIEIAKDKDAGAKKTDDTRVRGGPATLLVEKVYKGKLRVNDEFSFGSVPNAACIWTFYEGYVGSQFLLYLHSAKEADDSWFGSTCGRSRMVEYAREDLLYLDNMAKQRGKTRVSGNYRGWMDVTPDVANRTIRLVGEKKTYETKTDAHGIFEIYDLPPGAYSIEPEIPNGWEIAPWSVPGNQTKGTRLTSLSLTLQANRHATLNLVFVPTNAVAGTVVGPDGNPLKDVCVYLQNPDDDKDSRFDCTDKSGTYRIKSVPAGSYIAVLNPDGKLGSDELYSRLFYPSVAQRERAALITVVNGESVEGINFVIASLAETVTVSGILLFSDGKPAPQEIVTFTTTGTKTVEDEETETTDQHGRFTLQVIKGLKGEIFGEFQAYIGEYEKCAKLDELIRESGKELADLRSSTIKIEAEKDIENVVLLFPFPRCRRKG